MASAVIPFLIVNSAGLIAGLIGFATGCWARQRGRRVAIGIVMGICLLLCCKSALYQFPLAEAFLFPYAWYVWLQDYWTVLLGMLLFGVVIPQIPARRDRRALLAIPVLLLAMGVQRTWWMLYPETHGQDNVPGSDHHLVQSTMYTCAPSACAMAVSYVGMQVSERHMAELSLTRARGTTVFNSYRCLLLALEGSPWTVRLRPMPVETLMQQGGIAVVDFPHLRHALMLHGEGDHFTVHDPLRSSPQKRDLPWVTRQYGGLALVLEPR